MIDAIIFAIIQKIGRKKQKPLLGLSVIIIVISNFLMAMFLFPNVAILLFSINVIIIMAFIIKRLHNTKNN